MAKMYTGRLIAGAEETRVRIPASDVWGCIKMWLQDADIDRRVVTKITVHMAEGLATEFTLEETPDG